jgi:hypothetical protein
MQIFLLNGEAKTAGWSTDSAMQINRAYSVLRDPEHRRAYDQELQRQSSGREKVAPPYTGNSEKISYFPGQGESGPVGDGGSVRVVAGKDLGTSRPAQLPYVARSIDRVSSAPIAFPDGKPEEILFPEQVQPLVSPESWEKPEPRLDTYPKAVPMPESSRHHHSRLKGFFRKTLVVVALAAVLVALAVDFMGTPSVLKKGSSDATVADAGGSPEMRAGSVERGGEAQASLVAPSADASNISTVPVEDVSKESIRTDMAEAVPAHSESVPLPDSLGGTGDESPPVDKPVAGAVRTEGGTKKAGAAAGTASQSPPPSPVAAKTGKRNSTDLSPSRRLEAMRPREPEKKISAAVHPAPVKKPAVASEGVVAALSPSTAEQARPGLEIETRGDTVHEDIPVSDPETLVTPPVPSVPVTATLPIDSTAVEDSRRRDLDALLARFSGAYEAGTLPQLLALFAADASTNDQSSLRGIEQDYRELFAQTDRRAFVFERMQWKKDGINAFIGKGIFHVYVELKDHSGSNALDGQITFYIQQRPQGLLITRMVHEYE